MIGNRWDFRKIPGLNDFIRAVIAEFKSIENASGVVNINKGLYFVPKKSNGTWRIIRVGANIELQVRTAGVWVYQGRWLP